jgi:thiamine pyrophosphate-dependent acetolactate synthase large subunit-like protein
MTPPPLDVGTEAHLPRTMTEMLVSALAARGVRRVYGVPGGGSSLDVIAAANARGLRFVLMRNEAAAAMAAVAEAELTGAPGVVLTTKGPGVTNAANGIACASLERAPVVLLSDGFSAAQLEWVTHQVFDQRGAMAGNGGGSSVTPPRVVQVAQEVAREVGARPRVAVDAGAHMFSATAFWECGQPRDLLISNGLASMAYALPAGIAAALHDPARGAIAFTGDGGLMMCLGELASAAEAGARLVTIVFNDAALSLIDIKQQQRQMAPEGVRWARADFAKVAEGMGVRGFRAADEAEYRVALRAALAHDGPSLIDVRVDPAGYLAQLQAMRG